MGAETVTLDQVKSLRLPAHWHGAAVEGGHEFVADYLPDNPDAECIRIRSASNMCAMSFGPGGGALADGWELCET